MIALLLVVVAAVLQPWRVAALVVGRLLVWRRGERRAGSALRRCRRTLLRRFGARRGQSWRWTVPRTGGAGLSTVGVPAGHGWAVRDMLFRVHGWLAGAAVGLQVTLQSEEVFKGLWFSTRFEALTDVLPALVGLVSGVGTGRLLDRFPAWVSKRQLEGKIDGQAAGKVLEFGASAMTLLFVLGTSVWGLAAMGKTDTGLTRGFLIYLPLGTLASVVGYALPWLPPRRVPAAPHALWIVVVGRMRLPGLWYPRLVNVLARCWRDGPVTLLLDAAVEANGEHAHAADDAGRLRRLFPKLAVELADWAQALPPAERWTSLPVRELHPASELLLPALKRFLKPGDVVVLVARSAAPIAAWRDALRHVRSAVAWLGPQSEATRSVAGFDAIPVRAAGIASDAAWFERVRGALLDPVASPPPTPAPPGAAKKVFISYSHVYRALLPALTEALKAVGVEPLHDGLLTAGRPWGEALAAMLDAADAVVALVGSPTAASHHQSAEIERALQAGKPLIPIFVGPFDEPKMMLGLTAANVGADGQLRYLADCDPDELGAVLRSSAQRIAAALDRGASVAWPEAQVLQLTIAASAGRLVFTTADPSWRAEWSVDRFHPGLVDSLTESVLYGTSWDEKAARTLSSLLLPEALRPHLSAQTRVRLAVDAATAALPWEAAFSVVGDAVVPVSVVRTLVGMPVPAISPRASGATALWIGNQSRDDARAESKAFNEILGRGGFEVMHGAAASASALLRLILTSAHRIVLISAHAEREQPLPDGTRVTDIDGAVLAAAESASMRNPPELVFRNAPHGARIADDPDREAALRRSFPAQLLQRGVRTVIAADGRLDDAAATLFSVTFFEALIDAGRTIEEAMLAARRQVHQRYPETGAWAAYRLYGAADWRVGASA